MDFITQEMFLSFLGCLTIVAIITESIKNLPPLNKINTLWTTFGIATIVGVVRLFLVNDLSSMGIIMGILNIFVIFLGAIGGYETVKQITKFFDKK